jgi:fatty-acyl-CoA synthase
MQRGISHWNADTSRPLTRTSVGDALRSAAEQRPNAAAVISVGPPRSECTFSGLYSDAERAARTLLARFQPRECVAIWAPNTPEWLVLQYGVALAGLHLLPVNPACAARDLAYELGRAGAVGIFVAAGHRNAAMMEQVAQIRHELPKLREVVSFSDWTAFIESGSPTERLPTVQAQEPWLIEFTSGTTGLPKPALLHHTGMINSSRWVAERMDVSPDDRWLNFLPLFYVAGGVIANFAALQAGATQVLLPFEPGACLRAIERERCSLFIAPATILRMLLEHADLTSTDLRSLRIITTGGMRCPPELFRTAEQTLRVHLTAMYGQTEACGIVAQSRPDDDVHDRAETVGQPLPHVELAIVEPESGDRVGLGRNGEIRVRGYQVCAGYLGMPEATAATIDAVGWLHTGDLGSLDERGYLRIGGRLKEMINRAGVKIAPAEVEELLASHPKVAEVVVLGLPDAKWGEVIAAAVRPHAGSIPTEAELTAFCRRHLAPFKTPRHWLFLGEIPRTISGKVEREELRKLLRARTSEREL